MPVLAVFEAEAVMFVANLPQEIRKVFPDRLENLTANVRLGVASQEVDEDLAALRLQDLSENDKKGV